MTGTLHEDQHTFVHISLISYWDEKYFRQTVVEKIETHIVCSITFFKKIVLFMR